MRVRITLASAALTAATADDGPSGGLDLGLMNIGNSAICGTSIPWTNPVCGVVQSSQA